MDLESWEYIIEDDTKENNGGDSTRPRSHSVPDFSSFEIVSKHTVESALKQCVTDIHALEIMYNVNDEDEKRDVEAKGVEAKDETKDEIKEETRENNNHNVKNQIINSKRFENYQIENSEEVACCSIL